MTPPRQFFRVEVGRPGSGPLELSTSGQRAVAQRRAERASRTYPGPVFVWRMVERSWGGFSGVDSCVFEGGELVRDWSSLPASGEVSP